MEKFELQLENERDLYRELFLNAEKTFKELLKKMKSDFSCSKCSNCCKVRYSQLPPEEIHKLANGQNDSIAENYIKLFLPYGVDEDFEYSNNSKVTVEDNNHSAEKQECKSLCNYVKNILSKHSDPVYFYYCKYLDKNNNCTAGDKSLLCNGFPNSVNTILPDNCGFKHWQNLVMDRIQNEIEPEIDLKIKEIMDYKNKFQCKRTGTCCKLASSEFSYEELQQKAWNKDEFARQFTQVFVPYKNFREARDVFPEYVDLIVKKFGKEENINFYYCKYLENDNECPIYENRPQICRDFPDNPLSVIPPVCGYYTWKEEVLVAAYTFHAMKQIYGFYLEKIKKALT